ncbi:hypothetical protein MRX96_050128 [Rhipicephalus microplus]
MMTHAASRVAVDSYTSRIKRHVGLHGNCAPDGLVAAVDLSYFAALMTRKATYRGREQFSVDNWDSLTAVVPGKNGVQRFSGCLSIRPELSDFKVLDPKSGILYDHA